MPLQNTWAPQMQPEEVNGANTCTPNTNVAYFSQISGHPMNWHIGVKMYNIHLSLQHEEQQKNKSY
jgi:hypothetical protein